MVNDQAPENLYNQLANIVDIFPSQEIKWDSKDYPDLINDPIFHLDPFLFTVDVVCTTTALSASLQSIEDHTKIDDYYFLSHDISFTPDDAFRSGSYTNIEPDMIRQQVSNYITKYVVTVCPVDASEQIAAQYKISQAVIQGPVSNVLLLDSSPPTTQGQTQITSSIDKQLSGNIGFFGDTPQGGISASVSISNSKSYSIPDITVTNVMGPNTAHYTFQIQQGSLASQNSFSINLQHIFTASDLQLSKDKRSTDPNKTDSLVAAFEISILATWQVEGLNMSLDKTTSHVFLVRMPPLPNMD